MAMIQLEAKKREETGKGPAKRYRKNGLIPSIIYGQGNNINILINKNYFNKIANKLTKSTVIDLKLEDKNFEVLIRDYHKDYIKEEFIHLDFYELKKGKPVQFRIPIRLIGNPIGVREGGIIVKHLVEIEIECLPKDIVPHFDVNIEDMNIHDTIHVGDITFDEKYKVLTHTDEVIVHVSGKIAEEIFEEEVIEGEVIEGEEVEGEEVEGIEGEESTAEKESKE